VQRFYVARLQVFGAAVTGAGALVAAIVFRALAIGGPGDVGLALVGAFLLLATIGSRSKPVIELDGQEIRIRGVFEPHVHVVRREAGLAMGDVDLYGVRLTGREPWVTGLYARDGGRTLLVPTGKLSPEDRDAVEAALRRMIAR
jgi:hypothetical protein